MATAFDYTGPVLANTCYVDSQLVARDVAMTLPEINYETFDVNASGTISLPVPSRTDDMEFSITKIGEDLGLLKLAAAADGAITVEARWAKDVTDRLGNTKAEGGKAFLRAIPKSFPGIELEAGEASENEMTFTVLRYQLFINGREYCCIDKLNHILRIQGKDFYSKINPLI